MSSRSSGSHDEGGDNEDREADEASRTGEARAGGEVDEDEESGAEDDELVSGIAVVQDDGVMEDEVVEGAAEEQLEDEDYAQLGNDDATPAQDPTEDLEIDAGPATPAVHSPAASIDTGSIPDDTPSLRGSLLSTPSRMISPSPLARRPISRTVSSALQPFDRRFESRLSASPSSRAASPAFLSPHSRQLSISSQLSSQASVVASQDGEESEPPWDVIHWTKLRKITSQAFSDSGKRNFGRPTCLAVSALIAIGTTKGLILGFDYHQTLKIIIGQGTKAPECGSVTALAIAADYSTLVSGHANGWIFTWEIAKPAQPFLRIPPLGGSGVAGKQVDGHVAGTAILHVGFLGTRHTALVSADAGGMAFSHLASRGLGAVTRTIKSTRLLGRYPSPTPVPTTAEEGSKKGNSRKASSVLAFSPLPLGNVEQATDSMGLTALLTPYLLVIVSTTPIAQTQHKAPRPKEVKPHSTLSGCLAWFPAVRLKGGAAADGDAKGNGSGNSETKLVYCWSNILTVLEVGVHPSSDPNKPPSLTFRARRRWRAEEAIVAIQWLSRSVLGVMTVSQRLLIVEDGSLQVTDSVDLLGRHIYHQDIFSRQLQSAIELPPEEDAAIAGDSTDDPARFHGVVADAFYMSFRAYKGRTFLLGVDDLTVGTLSNWADRLVALMEAGDYLAAIRLGRSYYDRGANNVTVGLPEDDGSRHAVVGEKVVGMVGAAVGFALAQRRDDGDEDGEEGLLKELTALCFEVCISTMHETTYLFSTLFDLFSDAEEEGVFVLALESYVLDGGVKELPPEVVRSLVTYYISENQAAKLEEVLCYLDPLAFDLDQITMLCRQHGLYEALIHVWTLGIGDFVTPLVDLLSLVLFVHASDDDEGGNDLAGTPFFDSAMKVFPYLAYSLTGRRYPSGLAIEEQEAVRVRGELYEYLFAGTPTAWPLGSQRVLRTREEREEEPAFPYLVLLLRFDAGAFVSMLNEAFEDSFLNNEVEDEPSSSSSAVRANGGGTGAGKRKGYKMTRQHVLSILLSVMRPQQHQQREDDDDEEEDDEPDFAPDQVVYLDMFIARSLPKYPGQLALSGSLLNGVLNRLCEPPSQEVREDCELSVEYLLSAYRPSDTQALILALRRAEFWRVIRSVYRSEGMFVELIEAFFEGPEGDREGVFEGIAFCLRALSSKPGAGGKIAEGVKRTILAHVGEMAAVSVELTAQTLAAFAGDLLKPCVELLGREGGYRQFVFLRCLLEPGRGSGESSRTAAVPLSIPTEDLQGFRELYVQLMCVHDPTHVADYVGRLPSSDLRLETVLPAMEEAGVVDAAVVLLSRDGLARDAMERLVEHLRSLRLALVSMADAAAESPDVEGTKDAMGELVEDVEKYTKVGVWLCQGQSVGVERRPRARTNLGWDIGEEDLDLDEYLWLQLVDAVVLVTKDFTHSVHHLEEELSDSGEVPTIDLSTLTSSLRANVQQTFTSLLTATSATTAKTQQPRDPRRPRPKGQDNLTFLRILRAFLTRAAATAPSLSDLRAVLSDIFSAYTFEQGVLSLANDLLGSDVFAEIQHANELRQRGWRPKGPVCEVCKRRAWGPGVGELVWEEWVAKEQVRHAEKSRKVIERSGGEQARRLERGKNKAKAEVSDEALPGDEQGEDVRKLALVVFACKHLFHRVCLDEEFRDGKASLGVAYQCPICTA